MPENVIELENAYIYQKDQLILKDISFQMSKGEFVYLIGKTGSGKSSLLKALYAELWLEHGKGEVAGYKLQEIRKAEIPFLRRKIGIVFQDFQLLSDRNIGQNLRFFLKAMGWKNKDEIESRIEEVVNQVSLPDVLDKMPHQLSGGEQQRISIARALLNYPDVIMADEPTGNLDPEKSLDILRLFLKINEDSETAVIMATHDLELIERYPRRTLYCDNQIINDLSQNQ